MAEDKVFCSYAREDSEFVLRLAKDLRDAGQNVWLDQLDIPAGARWDREVEKALAECTHFLVVLSPASVGSPNVMDEVSYAVDEGKRLVPVMYEECSVPFRLRRFQYIDFTGDYEACLERTLSEFRRRFSSPGIPVAKMTAERQAPSPAPPAAEPRGSAKKWLPIVAVGALAIAAAAFFLRGGGDSPASTDSQSEPAGDSLFSVTAPPLEQRQPVVVPPKRVDLPNASMVLEPSEGEAPLVVSARSTSTGEIDRVTWDFGDGSPTQASPLARHTFTNAGIYKVGLRVVGPGGESIAVQAVVVQEPSLSGGYRIHVKTNDRMLHVNGMQDALLSTRFQVTDDYSLFDFTRLDDGSYWVRVRATGRRLHANELGDRLISTRWESEGEYSRFFFEPTGDGYYRIRVKATSRYLHEDGTGDKLVSTRVDPNDDSTRFRLVSVP